ncbi:MAG: hypothetical protein LIO46_06255 [Clostridiales bacterium]|nr:hypothetical protein [Clostridiales bacterium]
MKRICTALLCAALAASLFTACAQTDDPEPATDNLTDTAAAETTAQPTELDDQPAVLPTETVELYYNYFVRHARSLHILCGAGFSDPEELDDGTLVAYAIEEILGDLYTQWEAGDITEDELELGKESYLKSDIESVTTQHLGRQAGTYDTDFSQEDVESGLILPIGWSYTGTIRLVLTSLETGENGKATATFDRYVFGEDDAFDEEAVMQKDSAYDAYRNGTVRAVFTPHQEGTDAFYLTYQSFEVLE